MDAGGRGSSAAMEDPRCGSRCHNSVFGAMIGAPIYGIRVLGRIAKKSQDVQSNRTGPAILRTCSFVSSSPRSDTLLCYPAPCSSTVQQGVDF